VNSKLSVLEGSEGEPGTAKICLPYFASIDAPSNKTREDGGDVIERTIPVSRIRLGKAGEERYATVTTVFDLLIANYGVARGLAGENAALNYDDDQSPGRKKLRVHHATR
jgi:nitrate reductase / nitrite oxidoreductase, alpha subunit